MGKKHTAFPATPSSRFWLSSPYQGDSSYAWGVLFGNGYVYGNDTSSSTLFGWCVPVSDGAASRFGFVGVSRCGQ